MAGCLVGVRRDHSKHDALEQAPTRVPPTLSNGVTITPIFALSSQTESEVPLGLNASKENASLGILMLHYSISGEQHAGALRLSLSC